MNETQPTECVAVEDQMATQQDLSKPLTSKELKNYYLKLKALVPNSKTNFTPSKKTARKKAKVSKQSRKINRK